ncbi:NTP-binding protein [Mycobacterium heckeshornense]|nr:NTP-binding protein [Mycobacterium heckeshornense]
MDVARELYSRYRTGDNGLRVLLAWRGGWMRWRKTHWAELDIAELRSEIYDTLGDVDYNHPIREKGVIVDHEVRPWSPDKRKIANVVEALEAIGHLSADIDPPSWIDLHSAAETGVEQIISCENGLLDLSTRTIHNHTPAFFNLVSVPFAYDPNAPKPAAWFEFLDSLWPHDPDSIALLQEYIGYVLSGRTDMQKLLLLIGPTRSGKGTIARMLTQLVGRGHVAGPTLASLATNFGLAPLLGKPLAVISDARLGGKTQTETLVERLLSITGEDVLTVDRKFRECWTGKLPTRFVILSNELPRFRDSSGAIANRMLVLQTTESFLGREDRALDAKLSRELPGILNWALEGLDRLNRNGRFTVPASSEESALLVMDLASPVSAFVRERCVRDPHAEVSRDDLYRAWKTWAEDNGHRPGSKSTFGRDLRAAVPSAKTSRPRINGVQVHHYCGIGLCTTSNAKLPNSPDSRHEHTGHRGETESGDPDSADSSHRGRYRSRDSESALSQDALTQGNGVKPQLNGTELGAESRESGKSAFKAQHSQNSYAPTGRPGDVTSATPGFTDRVQQIAERLNGDTGKRTTTPTPKPTRLCPCGRPAPINPETGLCYWCERKAAAWRQAAAGGLGKPRRAQ